jgi:hypothetical protein
MSANRIVFTLVMAFVSGYATGTGATTTECTATGNNLAMCAGESETVLANGNRLLDTAQAYDVGLFDGFVWGIGAVGLQRAWCPTAPFTGNQISAITAKYVREHPERWGMRPADLVMAALASAFPCR